MKKQSTFILVAAALLFGTAPLSQLKAQNQEYQNPDPVVQPMEKEEPDATRKPLREEEQSLRGISIYPNPGSDVIHLDYGNDVEPRRRVTIYDLMGNAVLHQIIDESGADVSIRHLKPGNYILITGDQSFRIQKI